MGFFNKKPKKEKVYSIKETKEFISRNPNYTAIETIGGFKLIPDDKADVHIKTIRQKRNDFIEGLSAGEEFKNLEYPFRESSHIKREYTNYER